MATRAIRIKGPERMADWLMTFPPGEREEMDRLAGEVYQELFCNKSKKMLHK